MKAWLIDFPGTNAGHAAAILLILVTGLTVVVRLALGLPFPDGYGEWIWALVALAGVNVAGMGIKRLTDTSYKAAGTSPVTIDAPAVTTITTTAGATAASDSIDPGDKL
jgi:hypothetical protein